MAFTNLTTIPRSKRVFVVEETTPGTLAYPSSGDVAHIVDYPKFDQTGNYTPIPFIRESRTSAGKILNHMNYGTGASLSIAARPSGTPGVSPTGSEKTLLKALLGSVVDSSTTGASAVSVSSITQANPAVITAAGHVLKKGDKIVVANATETDYNVEYNVVSVSGNDITTDVDASGFGSGAASDGDVTIKMVRFEPTTELPYVSVWMLTPTGSAAQGGAVLEAVSGCQITGLGRPLTKDGILKYNFSIDFTRKYFGGSAPVSSSVANAAVTLAFDVATYKVANLFFEGMKVNIIDPAGTYELNAPVTVSAVNISANTVTVSTVSSTGTLPVGSIVSPYLPVGVLSGNTLAEQLGKVYLDDADTAYGQASGDLFESSNLIPILNSSYNVSQALSKPHEKEIDGSLYPAASFVPGQRDTNGTFTKIARLNDQKFHEDMKNTPTRALGESIGDTAGSIVEFYTPRAYFETPTDSDSEEMREKSFSWTAEEPANGTEQETIIILR